MFADVMIFDPNTIIDRATYEQPHQLSVGVRYVLVNGVAVVTDGKVDGCQARARRARTGVRAALDTDSRAMSGSR